MEKIRITDDYVFKTIFGKKGNEDILKNLLISILEIPIKEIEILHDEHLDREIEANKEGILDIRATLNNNIIVNIEMQVRNEHNMIDRSLYYWSSLYSRGLKKRQDYTNNSKTIAINILDYNIFKDGPYHEKCMITRRYNNEILTDDLEMHFIQIPKCEKQEIKTAIDFWIRFISNMKDKEVEKMKDEMSEETIEAIIKAEEEYQRIMADPRAQRLIERMEMARYDRAAEKYYAEKIGREEGMKKGIAEGKKEGMKQGMEKGMEKGRKDERIEIAKKMKNKRAEIDFIIETTGLTKEEIEKL